ncbi:GerMN domain-containing protein [Paenibacillus doosanensis]|uniref:Sporulation and spore germination n=1 Tax=Paenibacillus konkukensis TaxID=2020716 RepID=A0ABY4RJS4_9BACL|nr:MULTISPECIES: GerMN domain-containing protein [Paenibacillus]MCS7462519.1 GerMN domain-containing protein [Paenibacillus doosanensis]UQZ81874.1 Sporulation and spore germination [Paenibacillus konkukensis]
MQRRLVNGAIIGITLVALLAACGQKQPAPAAGGQETGKQAQSSAPTPTPTPAAQDVKQMKIKTYYGDENGERLVEQEAVISYKQDNDKYLAALKTLTVSSDDKRIPLMKGFTFNSVTLKDQTLTVDVSMAPESRLGSGGESLLLQALKKNVFQFSEIQNLDILLDGKAVESLMGHMDLPHPIKRG